MKILYNDMKFVVYSIFVIYLSFALGFGGICPLGHYCRNGEKYGCPDGSYQDDLGKTFCKPCPIGYYCHYNASYYVGNECPVGMLS